MPSSASQGDLLTLIEGKLVEASRDPLRTQVVLQEVEGGTHISLQDETGAFEQIDPPEPEHLASSASDSEDEGSDIAALRAEIEQLQKELEEQKGKTREVWRTNCEQIAEMDALLAEKEDENARLREELVRLRRSSLSAHSGTSEGSRGGTDEDSSGHLRGVSNGTSHMRRGKAPPVDTFCGVDPECRFEDWLPTLKRAAKWNGWTEDDLLLQLAGHLKGRALQ